MLNFSFKTKYIIYPLVAMVIIITTVFIWKETFNIQIKANDQKISNYATSISSILTACTIYLLLRQLSEMEKDRNAVSMPEIFPLDFRLTTEDRMYPNPAEGINSFLPEFSSSSSDGFPEVEFHNIGNGVAKNVRFEWIYDRDAVISYIDGRYTPYHPELEKEDTNFLPKEKSFSTEIPYGYFMCYGESLSDDFEDSKLNKSDDTKPKLELHITYTDIHNNTYKKIFHCVIKSSHNEISVKFSENR